MFSSIEVFSERVALLPHNKKEITYGELIARGKSIAELVAPRSLVLVMARNSPDFIASYVGLHRAKICQLIVSDTITPEALANLVATFRPNYTLLPVSYTAYVHAGEVHDIGDGYRLIELKVLDRLEINEHLSLLLSTSGSTGSPKLVRLSQQNIETNSKAIIEYLSILSTDRAITTMPLSYSFGLSILNTHLMAGASVVLTDTNIMNREFWTLFETKSVTSLSGVPYFFEMLKKLQFERLKLPSLRYITQAGGKLRVDLANDFTEYCLKRNCEFYIMYGQTEASPRMAYLCATRHREKISGIGRAIPGGEFWIQDAQGKRITGPGEAGELFYRGTNVSLGLAENHRDLALGDVNRGILATGDIAMRDVDGFYFIVGRKSRFLKVFGLRVNLTDLEAALLSEGYEAVCVGNDDKLSIFVANLDEPVKVEDLVVRLTGIRKTGFDLRRVKKIPRTSTGKVEYKFFSELKE